MNNFTKLILITLNALSSIYTNSFYITLLLKIFYCVLSLMKCAHRNKTLVHACDYLIPQKFVSTLVGRHFFSHLFLDLERYNTGDKCH